MSQIDHSRDTQRSLLANVSIDSDMSLDFTTASVDISVSGDSPRVTPVGPIQKRRSPVGGPLSVTPRTMAIDAKDLKLESLTARSEPLMPAQVRPAKEKLNNNHSKEVESGEKQFRSPVSPSRQPPQSLQFQAVNNGNDSSDSSTPDEDYKTPSVESVDLPGFTFDRSGVASAAETTGVGEQCKKKPYEAFYVDTGSSEQIDPRNIPLGGVSERSGSGLAAQSFTVANHNHTPESARAAGIPVVGQSAARASSPRSGILTQGAGDRSSSEGSDLELKKIHADHMAAEKQKQMPRSSIQAVGPSQQQRPDSLNVRRPATSKDSQQPQSLRSQDESPKTSFAAIKKQKENGESSPVMFRQPEVGSNPGTPGERTSPLKSKAKTVKKTTFANLPNQTTWQENAQHMSEQHNPRKDEEAGPPLPSELMDIRMKLEERRRQIEGEKRRMEAQWTKQRQKMGKQAFIQVVSKKPGERVKQPVIEEEGSVPDKGSPKEAKASGQVPRKAPPPKAAVPREGSPTTSAGSVVPQNGVHQEQMEKRQPNDGKSQQPGPQASPAPTQSKPVAAAARPAERRNIDPVALPAADNRHQERAQSTPPTRPTQGTLDSTSTVSVRQRSESPSHGKPAAKPFSREDLQKKIDDVKQKWLGDGESEPAAVSKTVPKSKPQPVKKSEPVNQQGKSSPAARTPPRKTSRSSSSDNVDQYGTSLDRLNSSLSELQGEIMRLSLQQDQIKCLVSTEGTPDTSSPPQSKTHLPETLTASSSQRDKFYLYPREGGGGGEPDVAGGRRDSDPTPTAKSVPASQPLPTATLPQVYGQPSQPVLQYPTTQPYSSYPQPPAPFPGHPPFSQSVPGIYPQYPGMPHPYQTSPLYQPQTMYQQQGMPYPAVPHTQWQQPLHPAAAPPPGPIPLTTTYQPQSAHTHTVSSHPSHLQSPAAAHSPDLGPPPASPDVPRTPATAHLQSPSHSSIASPQGPHPPSLPSPGATPTSPGGQAWLNRSPTKPGTPGSAAGEPDVAGEGEPDPDPEPAQPNEGFFVTLDTETPLRPKPKLRQHRRRDSGSPPSRRSPVKAVAPMQTTPAASSPTADFRTPPEEIPQAAEAEPAPVNVSPGVGFVVEEHQPTVSKKCFPLS